MENDKTILQEARQKVPEDFELCLNEYLAIRDNTEDWCDFAMCLFHFGFARGRQYEQSNGRETAV